MRVGRVTEIPIPLSHTTHLPRDPLAAVAVSTAPIALEGRYRLWWARSSVSAARGEVAGRLRSVQAPWGLLSRSWLPVISRPPPGPLQTAGPACSQLQGCYSSRPSLEGVRVGRLFTPAERPRTLARGRQRRRRPHRARPSRPLRRCGAGRGRSPLSGLSRRHSGALPLARHARPDRRRRARAARIVAAFPTAGVGVRVGLGLVAVAGIAAAALILALPRLAGSERSLRFRLGRWLSPRMTSRRRASEAWLLVSACWLVRAVAVLLVLGTLGIGFSFPLALLLLNAARRPRRCRSGRRARPRRSAAEAPHSSPRASEPRRRSTSPSPLPPSGSSPGPRSSSSPSSGESACR